MTLYIKLPCLVFRASSLFVFVSCELQDLLKTKTKNPIPVIARGKAQIQKAHVTAKVFPLELLKHKLFELSPMLLLLAHWLLLVLAQLFVGTMFSWRKGLAMSGAMKLPSANKKWRACMYGGDFSPQTFSKSTFPPAIKKKKKNDVIYWEHK